MKDELQNLLEIATMFRNERNWGQFHLIKDMLISLQLESSELLELAQWKSEQEIDAESVAVPEKFGDELADILYWLLLIADRLKIDLGESFRRKMVKNEAKYPVALAKGNKAKYDKF